MNVDCVGVRRRPNNSISGGRDAPWMLSVSLPKAAVRDRPLWVETGRSACKSSGSRNLDNRDLNLAHGPCIRQQRAQLDHAVHIE